MAEEWRRSPSFPDYEISSEGNVRRYRDGHSHPRGRMLKPGLSGRGYLYVTPCLYGKPQSRCIHRLVAEAFLGPCPNGYQVNHKDGDKANNRAINLEYCTNSENVGHAYRIGLTPSRQRLVYEQVLAIHEFVALEVSQRQIGQWFGIKQQLVSEIAAGKSYPLKAVARLLASE